MPVLLSRARLGTPLAKEAILRAEDTVCRLQISCRLTGHSGCVNTVALTPEADRLITGSDDCLIKLWSLSGAELFSYESGHHGNIFCARLVRGSTVISCAADGAVRLSELTDGSSSLVLRHRGRAHRLALRGDVALTCGEDGLVNRVDLRAPSAESQTLLRARADGHKMAIYTIAQHPQEPHIFAVAGASPTVFEFDERMLSESATLALATARFCPSSLRGSHEHITGIKYDWCGGELLASFNDDDAFVFDRSAHAMTSDETADSSTAAPPADEDEEADATAPAEATYRGRYVGHRNQQTVKQIAFYGPRSEWVVSGSDCGHIFFWRASDGKLVNIIEGDTIGAVNCLESRGDMGLLATSGLENDAKVLWPDRSERHAIYDDGGRLLRRFERVINRNTRPTGAAASAFDDPALLMQLMNSDEAAGSRSERRMLLRLLSQLIGRHHAEEDEDEEDAGEEERDEEDEEPDDDDDGSQEESGNSSFDDGEEEDDGDGGDDDDDDDDDGEEDVDEGG